MLYFAYGSNLDWVQMKTRCKSSKFVNIAKSEGFCLCFPRKSIIKGCGVAGIEKAEGCEVWGVVYNIEDNEIGFLDTAEGYNPNRETNSYIRREFRVLYDGDVERPISLYTYFPEPYDGNLPPPNAQYMDQIINGAKFWHLPEAYVRDLEDKKKKYTESQVSA